MVDGIKVAEIIKTKSNYTKVKLIESIIDDYKLYIIEEKNKEKYENSINAIINLSRPNSGPTRIKYKDLYANLELINRISKSVKKETKSGIKIAKLKDEYKVEYTTDYKIRDLKIYKKILSEVDAIITMANLNEEEIAHLHNYLYDTLISSEKRGKRRGK